MYYSVKIQEKNFHKGCCVYNKTKEIFSNNIDGNSIHEDKSHDNVDDQRFNTEKHHKKQHKF